MGCDISAGPRSAQPIAVRLRKPRPYGNPCEVRIDARVPRMKLRTFADLTTADERTRRFTPLGLATGGACFQALGGLESPMDYFEQSGPHRQHIGHPNAFCEGQT